MSPGFIAATATVASLGVNQTLTMVINATVTASTGTVTVQLEAFRQVTGTPRITGVVNGASFAAGAAAKVAAAAIIQLLRGEPVNGAPVLANTCYSFVTAHEAVHVASVHQYDAADKTFKTVPGSGGVSAAASQIEGRYALSWAENIWADSLAL